MIKLIVDARILSRNIGGIQTATTRILEKLYQNKEFQIVFLKPTMFLSELYAKKQNGGQKIKKVGWAPSQTIILPFPPDIPVVLTVHDLVWKRFPETMHWKTHFSQKLFFKKSINRASKIACVSQNTANDLIEYFPYVHDKVHVVPLGADAPITNMKTENKTKFGLFVGTFEPRKNLKNLLNAIEQLKREIVGDLSFVFVGNHGWGNENIETEVTKRGLADRITILRNLNDNQLNQLYASCSFLILPSLHEGFGLPVLEAMRYGKPVLLSSRGSLPEIAGQAALYFDPLNPFEISAQIENLYLKQGLYDDLSKKAKSVSDKYSWEKTAANLAELFRICAK